jgi:hypothetical protein
MEQDENHPKPLSGDEHLAALKDVLARIESTRTIIPNFKEHGDPLWVAGVSLLDIFEDLENIIAEFERSPLRRLNDAVNDFDKRLGALEREIEAQRTGFFRSLKP